MANFDFLVDGLESVFHSFTKPLSTTTGILLALRLCALLAGVSFFLAMVNNYNYIDCYTTGKDISLPPSSMKDRAIFNYLKAASTFCYMGGAFSVIRQTTEDSLHMGLGNQGNSEITNFEYYQWIPLVLLFLALVFRTPEKLWSLSEKGLTRGIVNGLNKHLIQSEIEPRIEASANYFVRTLKSKRRFSIAMMSLEVIGVAIMVGTILFLNCFFGGKLVPQMTRFIGTLLFGGLDDSEHHTHIIFPKIVKCTFQHYGYSGTVETKDFICLLPMNVLYEKIFFLMWCFLVFLTPFTLVIFLWHAVLFISAVCRKKYICLLSQISDVPEARRCLDKVLKVTDFGDDVVLLQIRDKIKYYPQWIKAVNDKLRQ